MARRACWWSFGSFVVVQLALGVATPGCGSKSGGSHGAAGASGKAGSHGSAGASGSAGAAGTAGASGSAGAAGTAGASGIAGSSGAAGASAGAGATAGSTGAAGATGVAGADASADAPGLVFDAGADGACGPVRLDRIAPDLLLLLDRSGSMGNDENDLRCMVGVPCVTKWSACTMAVNQVVQETEGSLNWGLKYFPTNTTCGVTAGVSVPVGAANTMPIAQSIAATAPGGSTPTRLAVASAADYLMSLVDPNPKALLLATDGEPNCAPGAQAQADDSAGAYAAVQMLANAGIPVYVIGIGNVATAEATLNLMAMAGGRPNAGATAYYPTSSSADLVDTLRAIGAQTMPCTYALGAVPASPQDLVVTAAGIVIPRDATHAEGWDYDASGKTIRLFGTWCAKDQANTLVDVEESLPCPTDR
jgi:hypothetical protein